MKNIVLLGWVGVLFAGTLFAGEVSRDGFRDFSSADGRDIRGRIIKYDVQRKKLFFERDNKKQMWIAPAAFCQKDQDYIKEWIVADLFLSESKLKISIKKKSNSAAASERHTQTDLNDLNARARGVLEILSELEYVDYELTMDNRTGAALERVRVEYRCLVERSGSKGHSDDAAWVSGKLEVGGSAGKGKNSYKTPSICLETTYEVQEEHTATWNDRSTVRAKLWTDDVCGVWFKVYGPSLDGVQVVREICLPSDFPRRHSWSSAEEGITNSASEPFSATPKNGGEERLESSEYNHAFTKMMNGSRGSNRKTQAERLKERIVFYDAQHDDDFSGYYSSKIGMLYKQGGDFELALSWYEKSLQAGGEYAHRGLAVLYASGSPETYDGAKAVEHALIALEGHKKDYYVLEILACAYARDGQFKMAIRTQKEVIDRLQKSSGYKANCTEYKMRLELYKSGKPFTM